MSIQSPTVAAPSSQGLVRGLSAAEVAERVRRGESNDFKARVGRTYWDIFRDNVVNLFNIILFSLLIVVLFFGDYATVLFAGFSVVTNSLLGMAQEINAKRKLDQLAAMAQSNVRVIREGGAQSVKMAQIVKDDIIPIEPGDRIIVDGVMLQADALEIDESQLTGESDAVPKEVGAQVSSGSFAIAGSGLMQATRVGKDSTINKLSATAKAYKNILTPTQQRLAQVVKITLVIMLIATPMLFVSGAVQGEGAFTLGTFRNAVVFVASLVPQGLVLTATLSLTIGALVISRQQTLVQRVNAVESMANVTALCFDKTGTLTQNLLKVREVLPLGALQLPAVTQELHQYTASLGTQNRTASAVAEFIHDSPAPGAPRLTAGTPMTVKQREIPFNSARKWGAIVMADRTLILGAPERVLPPSAVEAIERARALAAQGLRVLALSRLPFALDTDTLPDTREPLALIVLTDEVRPDIGETLQAFREQGVALKVISGDNPETVSEIARAAGMHVRKAYIGSDLDAMDDDQLAAAADDGDVFARIEPETKRRIIHALKRRGHYVAMVGDGVNDVPALKAADLAIVMNDGAQISKDIGDIVLLNNAMTTLPLAFHEGRTITQTIFATCKIFLVKNLYSTLWFILVSSMALPFPINPLQISWVTFGVVNVPATLIAIRLLRPAYMKRFRHDVLDFVVTAGVVAVAVLSLGYTTAYLTSGGNTIEARSTMVLLITFLGMIVVWDVIGVDVLKISTITARGGLFLLTILVAALTIAGAYIVPDFLEFTGPRPLYWLLAGALGALAAMLIRAALRRRWVNTLWSLFAP